MESTQSTHEPSLRLYVAVWLGLLLLVALEAAVAYARPSPGKLLASLLVLAVIEAAVALRYFMHLKYEVPTLFWTLIPALVFALIMMNEIWFDAHRLSALRFPSP